MVITQDLETPSALVTTEQNVAKQSFKKKSVLLIPSLRIETRLITCLERWARNRVGELIIFD